MPNSVIRFQGTDVVCFSEIQLPVSYVMGGLPVDLSAIFSAISTVSVRRVVTKPGGATRTTTLLWNACVDESSPNVFANGKFLLKIVSITGGYVQAPAATNLSTFYAELEVKGAPSVAVGNGGSIA